MGTRRLYDYIHNNPVFAFHPTEYINDPYVIGRRHKMVAINVALEVDLTGQVCADSLGSQFYSGIGGQVDFNRGASRSRGRAGRHRPALDRPDGARLAHRRPLQPRRRRGHHSRRRALRRHRVRRGLSPRQERPGAGRSADFIAHPDFREQLLREAVEAKYVRPEMRDVGGRIRVGPPEQRTSLLLVDGTQINFRHVHPTDLPRMKDLLYALSHETVYYRFMSPQKQFSQRQIQEFVYVDHRSEVAVVGTLPEASGEGDRGGRLLSTSTRRRTGRKSPSWSTTAGRTWASALPALLPDASPRATASADSLPRSCGRTSRCKPCSTRAKAASPAGSKATCIATGWISFEGR